MFGIGTTELIIIMFIILLIFGAKKLPELAQGLGKGIREFKRASNDIQEELTMNKDDQPKNDSEGVKTDEKKSYSDLIQQVTPDDVIEYGMIPEMVGRSPVITTLTALDENALIHSKIFGTSTHIDSTIQKYRDGKILVINEIIIS